MKFNPVYHNEWVKRGSNERAAPVIAADVSGMSVREE